MVGLKAKFGIYTKKLPIIVVVKRNTIKYFILTVIQTKFTFWWVVQNFLKPKYLELE